MTDQPPALKKPGRLRLVASQPVAPPSVPFEVQPVGEDASGPGGLTLTRRPRPTPVPPVADAEDAIE